MITWGARVGTHVESTEKCTRHEREQAIPFQNCDWKDKQSDYILVKKRSMNYGMKAVANVSVDRLGSRPWPHRVKQKPKSSKQIEKVHRKSTKCKTQGAASKTTTVGNVIDIEA